MASSSGSNLSKVISKIASSPAGSPPSKKLITLGMSPRISSAPESPFRKPVALVKQRTFKNVTATLSVPTPTRRPPSLPISPWNAEPINQTTDTELTNAVNKATKTSGVTNKFKKVKAKVDTGKMAPKTSVTAAMLKISDSTKEPKNPKTPTSEGQVKASVQVRISKSKIPIKPTASTPLLTDSNDKANLLKPSTSTSFGETDLETISPENETVFINFGDISASFSLLDDAKSKAKESSPAATPKDSFLNPNKNIPSKASETSGKYTSRAGSPHSQGSMSSTPSAKKNRLTGDRSRHAPYVTPKRPRRHAPYVTPKRPRKFTRRYNLLGALFAPFMTGDSYDTGMGSP